MGWKRIPTASQLSGAVSNLLLKLPKTILSSKPSFENYSLMLVTAPGYYRVESQYLHGQSTISYLVYYYPNCRLDSFYYKS
jgi:hypothetical protein